MKHFRRRLTLGQWPAVLSWTKFFAIILMLTLIPLFASFLGNRYEVALEDLYLPVVLSAASAALITVLFYRLRKRDPLAAVVGGGILAIISATQYDNRYADVLLPLQAILPLADRNAGGGMLGSLLFLVILGVIAHWTGNAVSKFTQRLGGKPLDWYRGAVLAAGATFAFQLVPLLHDLVIEWPQFFYHPPHVAAATAKPASKPDIYYIVLDRYASNDVLKQQFGYDDSDFLDFLKTSGYYVNPSAHQNYPYTTMSIASTMQADYLNDQIGAFKGATEQTVIPFNETVRQSPVAAKLKSLGYSYDLIGNWYESSNASPLADQLHQPTGRLTLLGHNYILNNFSKNFLTQSVLWRFLQGGARIGNFTLFSYTNAGDVDMTHAALQSLKDAVNQPSGGRFIFAHILVPHDPYYFNADGSLASNSESNNNGELLKQKYVGQVQYINSQMKAILTSINQSSNGQSVVVLQSDEGPYPLQLNDEDFDEVNVQDELKGGNMLNWSDLNLQMKFGNLAAYHVPAANLDTAAGAADSVNIFRLIFNTYFGSQMSYLPDCYYAYPDGRGHPMAFADITKRLTGQPEDSRCEADGTVGH